MRMASPALPTEWIAMRMVFSGLPTERNDRTTERMAMRMASWRVPMAWMDGTGEGIARAKLSREPLPARFARWFAGRKGGAAGIDRRKGWEMPRMTVRDECP